MLVGDEVYFVADTTHVNRALSLFGHDEAAHRRVVILGGGNIGLFLAQDIEAEQTGVIAKLIEFNKDRAEFVAERLSRSVVLHGDALDPDILDEANIRTANSSSPSPTTTKQTSSPRCSPSAPAANAR